MPKTAQKTVPDQREELPFHIVGYVCSLHSTDYRVSIQTELTKDAVYELFRTELVPLPLSQISEIPGGFDLHYTGHVGTLAGDFFACLFAAQFRPISNPLQWALSEIGATSCSELVGDLGTNFKAELIAEYYRRIDEKDVPWVLSIFSQDAIYRRGEAEYVGKSAIAEFYEGGRKIEGVHTIDPPIVSGQTVIIRGRFVGIGAEGASKDVRFTDMWTLEGSKVTLRETYLALGSSYVRE